ncbi:MAG: 2-keto-4-pentenoate hydratase/2-oxohepta-3-ene-1,7-dioic acid hydratase (catechol pathway) [Rhodobacteraceae bacterium HLUCCA12]|nr:MAG: 2-keto-4-pentenoate hydratase/2-oxohepta-3-ene-1,7-dioic acid hydratase (catechol pathway) [Rhodobacteraceae bacterium HLUCCA12]
MKLLRYGEPGHEKPGLLADDGSIRDLSEHVADLSGAVLGPDGLRAIAALDPQALPVVDPAVRLGSPVAGMRNFVCIGLNYADHAAETGATAPSEPILFLKSPSALAGPNDDIVIPPGSVKTDWECELAVVIGTTARRVPRARALDHVAGYTICNDVSEREWQMERGPTWDKGKGFDSFGPLGPWLVTTDAIGDPQALSMFTEVDGARMQQGTTANMIFGVADLVNYVSQCITLYPGDVIATGTPAGVGLGQKPHPVFLRAGQSVRLGIAGLGEQNHRTVSAGRHR